MHHDAAETAGEKRDQQHDQPGAGIAENELMNAQRAQQDGANPGGNLVLRRRLAA